MTDTTETRILHVKNTSDLILRILKRIPIGKTIRVAETEDFKVSTLTRFLKRKHKKGQLREFTLVTVKELDPETNSPMTVMEITRKPYVNFNFSYIA